MKNVCFAGYLQFKDLDGPYALSNIDKKREEGEGIPIFGDNPNKMPVKVNINPRSLKTTMANPKHQRKPKRLPLREVFNEEVSIKKKDRKVGIQKKNIPRSAFVFKGCF